MKLADIEKLFDLSPARRAAMTLRMGAELSKKKRKPDKAGTLPAALRRESITESELGPVLCHLHGVAAPEPRKVLGLSATGRRLKTAAGMVVDLVLTPARRRQAVDRAMDRGKDKSLTDLAIRQLAVGMMDSSPVPRCCAAYAYWQATGSEAALSVLKSALVSDDSDEFSVAAHGLANIDLRHVRHLQGTAQDDKPQTPANPIQNSMTVLIHGTFAKGHPWYQPGGNFHRYIKNNVYRDVYSSPDFYFWSGRYAVTQHGLKRIWRAAAEKLVSWVTAHPAKTLRLVAHSHGANVVNIATQMGLPACTLIQLSPPVRDWNLPDMTRVSSHRLFNIHSTIDAVVLIDGGAQDYAGTAVAGVEQTRIIALAGHAASYDDKRWKRKKVPALVRRVCP